MTAPRWELVRSIDGQFFARFIARNGRKIVATETYTRKVNALRAIRIVQFGSQGVEVRDLTKKAKP